MLEESQAIKKHKDYVQAPELENIKRIRAIEQENRDCTRAFEQKKRDYTEALKREHELMSINQAVSKRCETLREDIRKDVARGAFHSQSYTLAFDDADGKPDDCERISNSVSAHLPGYGITVRSYYNNHCRIGVTHTIDRNMEHAKPYFDRIVSGGGNMYPYQAGYAGPGSDSCQKLADELNSLNSVFNSTQVTCKATMIRGMCQIKMTGQNQGLVQRLINRLF